MGIWNSSLVVENVLQRIGTLYVRADTSRLAGALEMLVRTSWCFSRQGGSLNANLRFSPNAFFFRWMKMAVAASCSTLEGRLVSGTGAGSASEYMPYSSNTGTKSAVGFFWIDPEMN